MLKTILRSAKTVCYENLFAVRKTLPQEKSVITFTFDDAQVSCFRNGAAILEKAGMQGTYYLCGKLAGLPAVPGKMQFISVNDARILHQNGHQIACHTYSHQPLTSVTPAEYVSDAARNREFWHDTLGEKLLDFAYPLGALTLAGKRAIKGQYQSLRGIRRGINRDAVDMACLRAVGLAGSEFSRRNAEQLIEDCTSKGGWLIFFAHGVDDSNLKPFDTQTEDFKWVVEACSASGTPVLTVERARDYLFNQDQ